jgi:hypothetical protein
MEIQEYLCKMKIRYSNLSIKSDHQEELRHETRPAPAKPSPLLASGPAFKRRSGIGERLQNRA